MIIAFVSAEKMGNKDEDKEDLENMSREDLEEHLRKSRLSLEVPRDFMSITMTS